jgi:hypothetical protein
MHRLAVIALLLLSAACALAQVTQSTSSSDPLAVSLAQKSVAALTGGASVSDVTLSANVTSILGSDNESGTGTFTAKGLRESRMDLSLSGGTRSEVRNIANGGPAGAWSRNGGASTAYAGHNTLTDAAWFFPVLSSLSQFANPNYIIKYIGQEQHGGVNTQHIQISQVPPAGVPSVQRLSTTDIYLDAASLLPVAEAFKVHSDTDMNTDIPTEILFANYQSISGIQVPFHFQRMLNGGVILDVTVTSAVFNTGLQDSSFILP